MPSGWKEEKKKKKKGNNLRIGKLGKAKKPEEEKKNRCKKRTTVR